MSGSQSPDPENINAYATHPPNHRLQRSSFRQPTSPSRNPPIAVRGFLHDILNVDPPSISYGDYLNPTEAVEFPAYLSDMPTSRAGRLPNGYVDLTNEPDVSPEPPRKRPRSSATPGPSDKRLKRPDGTAARRGSQASAARLTTAHIEEIDLSDDKADIQEVLQKQRADAVKAQQKPEETPIKFGTSSCVICMDTPTDITATSCGHLFCHSCLMEALIAGENRATHGEQRRSQCPVCRKHISRTKPGDTIFLNFWKLPKKSGQP